MKALLILFFFLGTAAALAEDQSLLLAPLAGNVPLSVTISGPPLLLERAKACRKGFAGFGFTVDWGDGSPVLPPAGGCTAWLTHRYTVPGKFAVKVDLIHPGPNDAPVSDFSATATVEARAGKENSEGSVKVKLLEGKSPPEIFYGEGLPQLPFRLETTRTVELTAELVKGNGGVLAASFSKSASFTGEDSLQFQNYGNGPSEEQFDANGQLTAFFRITVRAGGKVLREAKSNSFMMNAAVKFRTFTVSPESGAAPLAVKVATGIFHPDCYAYIIDWGDGSPADERAPEGVKRQKGGCVLRREQKEVSHTFAKKGSYKIRWYDNQSSPFSPARRGPGYMEKQVKVH